MSETEGYSADLDALRARQAEIAAMLREKGADLEARKPIAAEDLIPTGDYTWLCQSLLDLITAYYGAAAAATAAGDVALAGSYYQLAAMLLDAYANQCGVIVAT